MKRLLIIFIILIVILGSGYYYQHRDVDNDGVACIAVVTPARNPATGEIREFPTPCDIPDGWDTLEGSGNEQYQEDGVTWQRYRNADLGLSFEYRIDPNGYTLLEPELQAMIDQNIMGVLALADTKRYQEAIEAPIEGPPTISVIVVNNPTHASLETWVKMHKTLSLYNSQTLTQKTVGGARTVSYLADGLYQNDMVVVDNNFKIYVISGGYDAPTDLIHMDFQRFLNSLLFF